MSLCRLNPRPASAASGGSRVARRGSRRRRRLAALLLAWVLVPTPATIRGEDLVVCGAPWQRADLAALEADGRWRFVAEGADKLVSPRDLVRWGAWPVRQAAGMLLLRDGSQLACTVRWDGRPVILWDESSAQLTCEGRTLGEVVCPRAAVAAILWNVAGDALHQRQRWEELLPAAATKRDRVRLESGDLLEGDLATVGPIVAQGAAADASEDGVFRIRTELGELNVSARQVTGVALAGADAALLDGLSPKDKPGLAGDQHATAIYALGLRDGTLLRHVAISPAESPQTLRVVHPACGADAVELSQIAFLANETLPGRLTAGEPTGYRHAPYLALQRAWRRGRSVEGGPLMTSAGRVLDGIGVTTATRLTYAVPAEATRFAAEAMIDATAGQGGSVAFRVYLRGADDAWRLAFASDAIRGGAAPVEIRVPLAEAVEIALVADYADRGDELDWADWLDPRFE